MNKKNCGWFTKFARNTARMAGWPSTFTCAVALLIIWGLTGPIFKFSDTWQLVVNTGTTIITFLMVFLIQNTQNRDSEAMHIKIDELIRASHLAHNSLLDLEGLEEEELDKLREDYDRLAKKARTELQRRIGQKGTRERSVKRTHAAEPK
jgi:low affinity Fe/Cu permease